MIQATLAFLMHLHNFWFLSVCHKKSERRETAEDAAVVMFWDTILLFLQFLLLWINVGYQLQFETTSAPNNKRQMSFVSQLQIIIGLSWQDDMELTLS